jgi:hypothetical protein
MVAKAASNPQMLNDLEAASSRQQQPITGNDLQELTNMNTSDLAAVVEGFFPNIELNSGNWISFTSGCSTCILKQFVLFKLLKNKYKTVFTSLFSCKTVP